MTTTKTDPRDWWVYVLLCRDGRTDTGMALDVERRFGDHLAGRGSVFTRINTPVCIVAARRYPAASVEDFDQSTLIPPVYEGVMLFEPGDTYHITVIKEGDRLSFTAETEGQGRTFSWDTSTHAPVLEGRVGFRQMGARRSRYENISIHVREPAP